MEKRKRNCNWSAERRAKLGLASRNRIWTAESRAKLSAANRGRKPSAEARRKMSLSRKGKSPTEETRRKISEAGRKRRATPETRLKMSIALKGKKRTAATKRRISIAARKRWAAMSPEDLKKWGKARSISNKGVKRSEAAKRRYSAAAKKRWAAIPTKLRAQTSILKAATIGASRRNESKAERLMHNSLDRLGVEYKSHVSFGDFVADIYLPNSKTVIECDGVYWHSQPGSAARDQRKDKYLKSQGLKVIRVSSEYILKNPMWATIQTLRKI